MAMLFSPSTKGFYQKGRSDIPGDAWEISDQDYRNLIDKQSKTPNSELVVSGKTIDIVSKKPEDTRMWKHVRALRNQRLAECDYTQLPDFPGNKSEWVLYRQQLRDLPQEQSDPHNIAWPNEPLT